MFVWPLRAFGGVATECPAAPLRPAASGFSLVVDLAGPFGTPVWWRGFATCAGLCMATMLLAPPLPFGQRAAPEAAETGVGAPIIPSAVLPDQPEGANRLDAADRAQRAALSPPGAGMAGPLRISGYAGPSLYLAMRNAGLPFEVIRSYLQALAPRLDFDSDLTPDARFDLVVNRSAGPDGRLRFGSLAYAGFANARRSIRLLPLAGGWVDPAVPEAFSGAPARPVAAARLSSGFGFRLHPLLGYSRFHKGVDLAAPWGAPVQAMADGWVARAGWAGGYGQLVQINHGAGLATAYAHLSRIAVPSGGRVRQGQVIGYVGSTGLSTGPHLHYEAYRNGVAVDPAQVAFRQGPHVSVADRAALAARLTRYQAMPVFSAPRLAATSAGLKTAPQ
ncbi:MAG: M23 family metallopeptidase [Chakrabartia sp.]